MTIPTPKPTPILALCDAATKGPWSCESSRGLIYGNAGNMICAMPHGIRTNGLLSQKEGVTDVITPNAQLIARLSPETVRAVYEALCESRDGLHAISQINGSMKNLVSNFCKVTEIDNAIALLDGHNINTEKK